MSAPTPATQPVKTKSKAYSSTVAIQGDAAKYRLKYKELKKKVREIEVENDKLHLKTLRIKRNVQRMRLERAILYERLEAESQATPSIAPYPPPPAQQHHYDAPLEDVRRDDAYRSPAVRAEQPPAARSHADYAYPPASGSSASYRAPSHSSAAPARQAYAAYDDYPPPPPRSHAHAPAHLHARAYAPPAQTYDRHHSPPAHAPASAGDRAERLRQYTESASPEPAPGRADASIADTPADALPPSASRSSMKVTLRRGA